MLHVDSDNKEGYRHGKEKLDHESTYTKHFTP
jgi:hypothetical protein